jgi:hypothetical protein
LANRAVDRVTSTFNHRFGYCCLFDLEGTVDVQKILSELRQEREQVEEAILSLERLGAGGKRRGRPPKWMVEGRKEQSSGKRNGAIARASGGNRES